MVIQRAPDATEEPAPASNRILNPSTDSMTPEEDHDHRIGPGKGPGIMLGDYDVLYGFQHKSWSTWRRSLSAAEVTGGGGMAEELRRGQYKFQSSHAGLWIDPPRLRRLELYSNATKSFKIADDDLLNTKAVCDSIPNWPLDTWDLEERAPLRLWE